MNDLSPDAFRQAARDAGTKMAVASGTPQAALAWLMRRSWKAKFLIAAVVMFTGYALLTTFADLTGLRHQRAAKNVTRDSQRSCKHAGVSLEQLAACELAREEARDKEWKARSAKAAADNQADQIQQKALADEKQRQRDAAANKQAAAEFARRLDAIANDEVNLPIRADRLRYRDETLAVLVQLLATTPGHPVKDAWPRVYNLRPADVIAVVTQDRKPIPGASSTARDELEASCADGRPISAWRARCAAGLKRYAPEAAPMVIRSRLDILVESTALPPDSSQ